MCKNMLFIVLLALCYGGQLPRTNNDTRFIHRHACYGADDAVEEGVDTIGCAESEAAMFEHTLTPSMLWCNVTHCQSRFGDQLDVHAIDCDVQRCRVLVHCVNQFSGLKYAAVLTALALVAFIAVVAITNVSHPPMRHQIEKML